MYLFLEEESRHLGGAGRAVVGGCLCAVLVPDHQLRGRLCHRGADLGSLTHCILTPYLGFLPPQGQGIVDPFVRGHRHLYSPQLVLTGGLMATPPLGCLWERRGRRDSCLFPRERARHLLVKALLL